MRYVAASTSTFASARSARGLLHVICGCMFAGKTEALIDQVALRSPSAVKVFKHAIDDRYDANCVVSHRQRRCAADAIDRADLALSLATNRVEFVAIDEGHFFDHHLVEVCQVFVTRGVSVSITALDRDSWGQPFPIVDRLRSLADVVTVKHARCGRCGDQAGRTQRLTPIINGRMVAGVGDFEPRCETCWTPPPVHADQMTRLAANTGPWAQHSS